MSSRVNRILSALGAVTVLAGSELLSVASAAEDAATAAPTLSVTVATVRREPWPEMLVANGAIEPWQEAIVSAAVGGQRIEELLVEVGDTVKAGQLLVRLDRSVLEAAVAELEAALAQAKANLAQAEADAARAAELEKRAALSAQEILRYRTQAGVARAGVQSAEARLQAQRLQLERTRIVAPDDGVITERMARLGEVPSLGQELFRMIRRGRLEWRGELTAAQIVRTTPGKTVMLRLPDGSSATARVRKLAPAMRSENRLGEIHADIEPGSAARAGMYVAGTVLLDPRDALVVPAASVVIRDGRSYLFVVAPGQNPAPVAARPIATGRRSGDEVEVVSGVEDGAQVVVQGAGFLNDGDVVRIITAVAR
ncbi:MAG: efflux RND transporter periplasmic adaptor subunit [Gammaproteobacteria bacterium]|nr:efflux RND transporter periplasmic adaptor subunit [Gammaproteobacteria bacterium]